MITTIFSDDNQVKRVGQLTGDDTQNLIDMIDEVNPHTISSSKVKSIDVDSNLRILSIRDWIASHRRSAGDVYATYTASVTVRPYFRNR